MWYSVSTSFIGVSAQIEYSATVTPYEAYDPKVPNQENIYNELDKKLTGEVGKNIFNKNTTNVKNNCYVNFDTGKISNENSNYKAYIVKATAGTVLSFSLGNIHVCAFSAIPDLSLYNFGDQLPNYITGFADSSRKQNWTVPADTVCLVVSVNNSYVNSLQIEQNSETTSFVPYYLGLPTEKITGLNFYTVGENGNFETIQDAVNSVPDYSIIYIEHGTYQEAVDIRSTGKTLHLIGAERDRCILTYSSGDYQKPPLEIDKGFVENLTIKATGTTLDDGASQSAYCVHIDYDGEENSALQFINCNFENDIRNCVGIGLRQNFTVSFKGCSFVTHTQNLSPVYCHEQQASNKTGQRLELIDCSVYNDSNIAGYPIYLQESSEYTGNTATILIQRCIVKYKGGFPTSGKAIYIRDYSTSSEASGGAGYLGSHTWYIDPMSDLNNEDILNV